MVRVGLRNHGRRWKEKPAPLLHRVVRERESIASATFKASDLS